MVGSIPTPTAILKEKNTMETQELIDALFECARILDEQEVPSEFRYIEIFPEFANDPEVIAWAKELGLDVVERPSV